MREYSLQDPEYRKTVDLRNYKTIIEDSIHQVAPDAVVTVYKDRYTITPDLSKGQLIKIGRLIAQTTLRQYCMIRPILFKGEVIEDDEDYELSEDDTKKERSLPIMITNSLLQPQHDSKCTFIVYLLFLILLYCYNFSF